MNICDIELFDHSLVKVFWAVAMDDYLYLTMDSQYQLMLTSWQFYENWFS